ncbi:hypothetical protein K8Q98_01845 [Candidatus Nomurabacteria bacterium]|nr:hypothetical protein [Candidatus Nomurabacteria bacterium]
MKNQFEPTGMIVGVKTKPDGTRDYSKAAELLESDADKKAKRDNLAERLKIPESIKPGTPDMVFIRLRNAIILAKDPAKAQIYGLEQSILSSILNHKKLSIDEVYDALQKEITDEEKHEDKNPGTVVQRFIKARKDLQMRLLEERQNLVQ